MQGCIKAILPSHGATLGWRSNVLEYEPECEALNLIFHEEECISLDIDSSNGCHNFSVINSIECQLFVYKLFVYIAQRIAAEGRGGTL